MSRAARTGPAEPNPGSALSSAVRSYWPRWASVAMLASGAIVVLADTENLLLAAGVALVALGLYGLLRRRAPRPDPSPEDAVRGRPGPRAAVSDR